jgi:hypothetical protein
VTRKFLKFESESLLPMTKNITAFWVLMQCSFGCKNHKQFQLFSLRKYHYLLWSRDRSIGIGSDYGLNDEWVGVRVPVQTRLFSSPQLPDLHWGPPSPLSHESRGGGVKRPVGEADHSPPASAEVKKTWIYISTLPYVFIA